MSSELYVQIPATYGDYMYAGQGSSMLTLAEFGRDSGILLNLHLQMVLYSKRWRLEGVISQPVARYLARPASPRTADRDLRRLVQAGFIEPAAGGFYVPAAVEWAVQRVGTRDPIRDFIRARVYERDGWRCVECRSEDNLTLDHIIPWSLNGPDDEKNLRTLCGPCNSRKGART